MMNLNYENTIGRPSQKWGKQNNKPVVSQSTGTTAASTVKDQINSTEGAVRKDYGFQTNPDEALKDTVRKLLKTYPNIDITYGVLSDNDAIRKYAASAGGGFHITVTRDFLEWMSTDPQSFQDGKEFLDEVLKKMREEYASALAQGKNPIGIGAVVGENGQIDVWTSYPDENAQKQDNPYQWILDTLKANKEAEIKQMQQKKKKIIIKKKPCYSARRDLSMLARVSTVQDVRGLISQVNSRASSMKLGAADANERAEVKRAIAQMESVVQKAKVKIKKLKEESIAQQRQKKLIAEQRRKEALQEKLMLNRRKALRRARENTQVAESLSEEIQQRQAEASAAASEMPMMGDVMGIDASLAGAGVSVDIASVGTAGVVSGGVSVGADVAVAVQSINVSI